MWCPILPAGSLPRYLAIVEALAQAIRDGTLRPGDRLPPQRDLAWGLKLNLSTVTQAYREAARRHLISGEVGRGTFVLADSREATLFALKGAEALQEGRIDLSTNLPASWLDEDALHTFSGTMLDQYLSPSRLAAAEAAAAQWLRDRQVECRPTDIVLCAGAQQGLFATLLSLCAPGDPVLVEACTFPGMKVTARQLRLPLHGVAQDERGILPDAFDRAIRATGARVAVLMPCLQNPTGASMDAARRQAIADIIHRHKIHIIEDDVYGALNDQPPLFPLIRDRGVLLTSLSKIVAPGLRFGIMTGPPALLAPIRHDVHATRWPMAPAMVDVARGWIEDGTAARRLAWQRGEILARWRLAQAILPAGCLSGRAPAPHLWLAGPTDHAARCRQAGVDVAGLEAFAVSPGQAPAIRLSLTAAPSRAMLHDALLRVVRAATG